MIDINTISRLGIGAYRMSVKEKMHHQALHSALENGCNLIDTSTNYMDGDSERLIGQVLKDHQAFVISKAGYIQGNALEEVRKMQQAGKAPSDLLDLGSNLMHCIHPDFLRLQLEQSLNRLNRTWIDAYLLHNPEYYWRQKVSTSRLEYYARLQKAMEFLEEQVRAGRIRYYGISSNTFAHPLDAQNSTNLYTILDLLQEVSIDHHFRFIQFPYNLVENEATHADYGGTTLLTLAHKHGIRCLGNRPLNAHSKKGFIRLANYEENLPDLNPETDKQIFEDVVAVIQDKLDELATDTNAMELEVVQFLQNNWMQIGNHGAVDQIFYQHLVPLLSHLFEGKTKGRWEMDTADYEKIQAFRQHMLHYSTLTMSRKAQTFRQSMIEQGVISPEDPGPLPVIACDTYLKAGIDHVLIGMRKQAYVRQMKVLF